MTWGLGDTCQWPQPGIPMYYPPCTGASPIVAPASATPAARGGTVAFHNTTTGNASSLAVGDRWQLAITGASPNAPVLLAGSNPKGAMSATMGTTDGQGNFALTGQITADQLGAWSEAWSVAGVPSGSFSFVVTPNGAPGIVTGPAVGSKIPAPAQGFDLIGLAVIGAVLVGAVVLLRR